MNFCNCCDNICEIVSILIFYVMSNVRYGKCNQFVHDFWDKWNLNYAEYLLFREKNVSCYFSWKFIYYLNEKIGFYFLRKCTWVTETGLCEVFSVVKFSVLKKILRVSCNWTSILLIHGVIDILYGAAWFMDWRGADLKCLVIIFIADSRGVYWFLYCSVESTRT